MRRTMRFTGGRIVLGIGNGHRGDRAEGRRRRLRRGGWGGGCEGTAAMAAGCSAGGVGSDGGGSIRVPAHFSGICGLKPTPGRVPSTGHYPASAGPFAQLGVVGPMARTVADVARLFSVTAGHDMGDPVSAPVPLRAWSDQDIHKLGVAYFVDDEV